MDSWQVSAILILTMNVGLELVKRVWRYWNFQTNERKKVMVVMMKMMVEVLMISIGEQSFIA